ncbi:hypothetical protein PspLS_01274 [Pyricularia sp. CBS 133598]|nr:hypothetical protein PspLS_01274 [Pyricularia sp. CBS 133598]
MPVAGAVATGFLAALHGYITVLEMFMWTKVKANGRNAFGLSKDFAEKTSVLAANQGLYNGLLGAGLAWAAVHPNAEFARQLRLFFVGCVCVAGSYGGYSSSRKIFMVQGLPAFISFAAVYLNL